MKCPVLIPTEKRKEKKELPVVELYLLPKYASHAFSPTCLGLSVLVWTMFKASHFSIASLHTQIDHRKEVPKHTTWATTSKAPSSCVMAFSWQPLCSLCLSRPASCPWICLKVRHGFWPFLKDCYPLQGQGGKCLSPLCRCAAVRDQQRTLLTLRASARATSIVCCPWFPF